ncbi:MAG TPA: CRTAC1 family protein [Chthoniobacterales bacterium]
MPTHYNAIIVSVVLDPSGRRRFSRSHFLHKLSLFLASFGLVAAAGFTTAFAQQFEDTSVTAGILHIESRAWGNPIWGDINNDGYLDLIVPVHELDYLGGPATPFVYINNKNGTFTESGAKSGLDGNNDDDNKDWLSYALGDYDGDGNLDFLTVEPPFQGEGDDSGIKVLISSVPTRNPLYHGNGDGTFTYAGDVLETGRNYGECGVFVDYDNDGLLDIFVKNQSTVQEPGVNVLYHNNGDGTFAVVPGAGGLEMAEHDIVEGALCSFADYDNDGYMDVVMGGNGASEALYHNNGDGTFTDVTVAAGITARLNAMGLAWGDYDNDGLLDLYISRGKQSGLGDLGNSLYHNNGDGTFTDVTATSGTNDNTNTWAAVWGDYDNDGFLDLFIARPGTNVLGPGNANILYHNNGDGTFTDVAATEGVALETDHDTEAHKLAAWGDYDNDGFLDLVVQDGIAPTKETGEAATGFHYLLRNKGNSNHYLKVNLHGMKSNRYGLGARVTVTYDGGQAFRENTGDSGGQYASQSSEPLHFGIGSAATATIQVNWPSGMIDLMRDVAANSTLTLVEGENPPPVQPQNISTRLDVQSGANVGIGGFIITGSESKQVLIRGLGPSLGISGVQGVLADPILELHEPTGPVVTNDNWKESQQDDIMATGLAPTSDAESAILATLPAGAYTAVLSGQGGGTGIGLVEVYGLGFATDAELANVSTRGFVGTGDNVLIGGVIIGPTGAPAATLVVRALGPSLSSLGVTGTVADPVLELHDSNGALLATNNNWQDDASQVANLQALGLAPTDSRESAIYTTVPVGLYTAIVTGDDNTTGVGLVEIYNIK